MAFLFGYFHWNFFQMFGTFFKKNLEAFVTINMKTVKTHESKGKTYNIHFASE